MSSADELLAKVKKAAKHPKALLFGALAAECRTPTQTASAARKEHGLSNEEEKLVKAVAVLKRDSISRFGRGYLEVLAEVTEKPKERKMKITWGLEHFRREVRARKKQILSWILGELEMQVARKDLNVIVRMSNYGSVVYVISSNRWYGDGDSAQVEDLYRRNSAIKVSLCGGNIYSQGELRRFEKEYPALEIEVFNKDLFNLAHSFGRAYEKEAKKKCVEIIKRY